MDSEGAAEHNAGDVAQGSCLFYDGGHHHKISAKEERSFGGLIPSNQGFLLERAQLYVKGAEQVRCSLYEGGLNNIESRKLFTSQETSKRLRIMASENQQQHEQLLLSAPTSFPYAVIEGSNNININNNNNNLNSSVEGCSNNCFNVRSSLVVESNINSKEDSFFQRAHISATTNPLLNIASTSNNNNIPIALPLLSSSCKNDPPLLQDLPWFANHALEEEEQVGGLAGFPLVRPTAPLSNYANPSNVTNTSSFSAAHARSSLISLLGETDAEQCILQSHIVAHPLFEQLLAAHLACLRMGTPPERWPDTHSLDARLTLSRQELDAKYLLLARNAPPPHDKDNLDHFMLSFTLLLQTFREQLREHMQVHSAEAASGCAEIKDAFFRLTGESRSIKNNEAGSTMSEDEEMMEGEEELEEGGELHAGSLHHDPTIICSPFNNNNNIMMAGEIDKSLMESVRRELKLELKQNYRSKLWDVREEIMRKRRAGKLPGSTTSLLKDWWDAHSKWPYPTEEEKMKLVQETGLELKQINNWFINQRKRNWNTNPAYERADMDEFSLYGSIHPAC